MVLADVEETLATIEEDEDTGEEITTVRHPTVRVYGKSSILKTPIENKTKNGDAIYQRRCRYISLAAWKSLKNAE